MSHKSLHSAFRHAALRWWADESGFMEALNYILITAIVTVGTIAGLTTFRNEIMQGFGDISDAMQTVNQSYTVNMTFAQIGGGTTVKSYGFTDTIPASPVAGSPPACMNLTAPATPE